MIVCVKVDAVHAKNRLTNFTQARNLKRTTAVRNKNLEVIGWDDIFERLVTRVTSVAGSLLIDFLLAYLTGQIKHLLFNCIRNEDPGQFTYNSAEKCFPAQHTRVLTHKLFHFFKQKNFRAEICAALG